MSHVKPNVQCHSVTVTLYVPSVFIQSFTLELTRGAPPIRSGTMRPKSPSFQPTIPHNTSTSVWAGPTLPSSSPAPPATVSSPPLVGSGTTCTPSHLTESSSGSEVNQSSPARSHHRPSTGKLFLRDRSLSLLPCHQQTHPRRGPGHVGG